MVRGIIVCVSHVSSSLPLFDRFLRAALFPVSALCVVGGVSGADVFGFFFEWTLQSPLALGCRALEQLPHRRYRNLTFSPLAPRESLSLRHARRWL